MFPKHDFNKNTLQSKDNIYIYIEIVSLRHDFKISTWKIVFSIPHIVLH